MKKTAVILFLMLSLTGFGFGQITTPAASPTGTVTQNVGLINIEIEYSRPSVKGRKIFGDLLPYGEVWRVGANSATKITFSGDVTIGGTAVKAGSYALLAKPGMDEWQIMLYPYTTSNWMAYPEETPLVTLTVNSEKISTPVETLTIGIDHIRSESAHLVISWENTLVKFPVELNTDQAVMASIDRTMAGPSANDYYAAASYYFNEGKDAKQALEWVNKCLSMGPERYWIVRLKSQLQAENGDFKGAIETAKRSMALAKEANNQDYVRLNEKAIEMWMKKM
ncbi:MAG: DUF2911 domain-containing protein [Saprospiraceae bacterium]|nr:DUF2911 domain-containing protein [Saprospiraceae bacterium]MCB9319625.1 DUF2911 domain-containing protein [Lewinellaceae bacterium]